MTKSPETNLRDTPQSLWKRWLSLALGVALLVAVLYFSGLDRLSDLPPVHLPAVIVGIFFIGVSMLAFSLRWFWLIRTIITPHINVIRVGSYSLTSLVMGNLFAQTATVVVVRSGMLKQHNDIPLRQGVPSVVLDKLFDLGLVVLYAPFAFAFLSGVISQQTAVVFILIFTGVIVFSVTMFYSFFARLFLFLETQFNRLLRLQPIEHFMTTDRAQKWITRFSDVRDFAALQPRTLLPAMVLTIIGEALLVGRSYAIAQSVGLDVSPGAMILGVVIAQASFVIAITPGGLGIVEGAWFVVFLGLGIDDESIAVFLLLQRLLTTLVSIGLWVVVSGWLYVKDWSSTPEQ